MIGKGNDNDERMARADQAALRRKLQHDDANERYYKKIARADLGRKTGGRWREERSAEG